MAQQFVQTKIKGDKVVLFIKPTCSYCIMAEEVLSKYKFKPGHLECIDISGRSDMDNMQEYFLELTGARTLPKLKKHSVVLPCPSLEEEQILQLCPKDTEICECRSHCPHWPHTPDGNREVIMLSIVPRVFIGEECVGGGSDVAALHKNGKLQTMLQSIGALQ